MAVSLYVAIAVLASGQNPSPSIQPDVLLFRADEAGRAQSALREGSLNPATVLVISAGRPSVVCYGRLAEELKEESERLNAVTKLFKGEPGAVWSGDTSATMRSIMDLSPFRNEIRSHAAHGVAMRTQFLKTTRIEFESNGKSQMILLDRSPIGKAFDLPTAELRLSSLSEQVPARLLAPKRADNSIACIVPDTTPADAKNERMEKGLKLLFARQREIEEGIRRAAPEAFVDTMSVSNEDRSAALAQLSENYAAWGFKSSQEAIAAFSASPTVRKSFSIGVRITPDSPPGNTSSISWGIVSL